MLLGDTFSAVRPRRRRVLNRRGTAPMRFDVSVREAVQRTGCPCAQVVNDAGGGSWLVVVGGLANSDGASKILGDVWVLSIVSPYSQMTCVRCPTLALRPICDFEDSGT